MARLSLVTNAQPVDPPKDVEASKILREKLLAHLDNLKSRIRAEANRRTLAMMAAERGSREIFDLDNSYRKFENELFSEFDENQLDQLTEIDYNDVKEYAAEIGEKSFGEAITLQYLAEVLGQSRKQFTPLPLDERLKKLEEFAIANSGKGVAEFAKIILPELNNSQAVATGLITAPALPTEAPATWRDDKLPNETPPVFIQRVYREWIGEGLDRALLRSLDPSLGRGLDNWLRKNQWPDDIDLPTRGEQNRRLLEAGGDALASHLGKFTGAEAVREIDRIRRSAKKSK